MIIDFFKTFQKIYIVAQLVNQAWPTVRKVLARALQQATVAPGYTEPGHSESLAVINGEGRKIWAPPDLVCYSEKKPCSVLNGAIGHQQG